MARRHRMRGSDRAFVDTRIRCSDEARRALRIIARELVRTRCVDRVVECEGMRHVVVADCPTSGAARLFESQVGKHVKVWKAATGR